VVSPMTASGIKDSFVHASAPLDSVAQVSAPAMGEGSHLALALLPVASDKQFTLPRVGVAFA
jgi:hypothetical protein